MQPDVSRYLNWSVFAIMSALCLVFSNGLDGHYGFLQIMAYTILIVLAHSFTPIRGLAISILIMGVGQGSWFTYLQQFVPLIPSIILTMVAPLGIAFALFIGRKVNRNNFWSFTLAFPLMWTSVEFIFSLALPDGTFGSIAYAQSDSSIFKIIASITGIHGVTLFVLFISSALAWAWLNKSELSNALPTKSLAVGFITLTLIVLGVYLTRSSENTIRIGAVAMGEETHQSVGWDKASNVNFIAKCDSVLNLMREEQVEWLVFPEKSLRLADTYDVDILTMLKNKADSLNMNLAIGVHRKNTSGEYNELFIISPQSEVKYYRKVHLVNGWEDRLTAGHEPLQVTYSGKEIGFAICKDMDFPQFIRNYNEVGVLLIPAWDFDMDGWLHSRMAVMRSAENGFAMVRSARDGQITITDQFGSVIAESVAKRNAPVVVFADVSSQDRFTISGLLAGYLGWLCVICSIALILISIRRK